jgi:hypothetical protein
MSLYRANDAKFWVTSYLESAKAIHQKRQNLMSGRALRGHIWSAHHGKVDPACPACNEIQRNQERLKAVKP